jgi:hypothetical protein
MKLNRKKILRIFGIEGNIRMAVQFTRLKDGTIPPRNALNKRVQSPEYCHCDAGFEFWDLKDRGNSPASVVMNKSLTAYRDESIREFCV